MMNPANMAMFALKIIETNIKWVITWIPLIIDQSELRENPIKNDIKKFVTITVIVLETTVVPAS